MRLGTVGRGIATAVLALAPTAATAQSPAEFYKGKNVELYIGYSVGGAYDLYARVLARHLGRHIPGNPTIIPKNMEGAGSLRLANWLYNVGAKDGTVLATIGRGTGFDPLLGSKGAQFQADKFTWIGSANNEVSICVAWKGSGITKFEDTMTKELIVGGTGAAADTDQFPRIINGVLGTKMKIITGYPGGNDVNLAMERGEVGGRGSNSWASWKSTRPQWLAEKKVIVLVQVGVTRNPELPDIPTLQDLAKNEADRQVLTFISADTAISRPLVTSAGVPPERVEALRRAFDAAMKDSDFLAEAEKSKTDISPMTGEEAQKIAEATINAPAEVRSRASKLIEGK
jgi:tripartite-type tricarboxylate transporter receptor subunit TctC